MLYPFVIVTSSSFRMRNTVYRNIRFGFARDFAGAYRVFVLPLGIIIGATAVLYGAWEASDLLTQIEQEDETGEFRKEVADIDALVLVGAPVYAAVWNILFDDLAEIDAEKLAEDFLKVILNGLGTIN